MRNHVNLMSDNAVFSAAAKLRVRRWAVVVGVLIAALIPIGAVRWQRCSDVRVVHEALEARYEPMRQLTLVNRTLSAEAAELVQLERVPLHLSRKPTATSLIGLASRAAATSAGEMFIEQIILAPMEPADGAASSVSGGRMVLEVAGTLTYNIAQFVDTLDALAFNSVSVTKSEVVSQDGVDRRKYTIECLY